ENRMPVVVRLGARSRSAAGEVKIAPAPQKLCLGGIRWLSRSCLAARRRTGDPPHTGSGSPWSCAVSRPRGDSGAGVGGGWRPRGGPGGGDMVALSAELDRLRAENARLQRLLDLRPAEARPPGPEQTGIFDAPPGPVDNGSSSAKKLAFYRALFAARSDVYAVRWENRRSG